MSSMRGVALILPFVLGFSTAGSTQTPNASVPLQSAAVAAPAYGYSVAAALNDWRRLRQSGGYSFADYARFLVYNPGWPSEDSMRRKAEQLMRPGENAATVLAFYSVEKPPSGNGFARLADALSLSGRHAEALIAAREAWASADLSAADEQSIYARWGANFTRADNDRRVDALLFAKDPAEGAGGGGQT